jgi:glyoxylase-like metal-dependent hydrolase (beta-lactamase superfamily II)
MDSLSLSRRHAFKLAGLTGAVIALRDHISLADAPATQSAALPQGAGFYRTHVGKLEVTVISDGSFPIAPAFPTFGANASQEAVEATLKENFLDPAALMGQVNVLAVREGSGPVTLIDTGCGKLFGPLTGFARQNLAAAGIAPEDVKHVIFTHLHPDHAGGAVVDGKAAFPNATHHCHQTERDFWTGPNPDFSKSGAGEMAKDMIAGATSALTAVGPTLHTFHDNRHEVVPGITAVVSGGHTPGHCILEIASDGQMLVYVGDLIIQSVLVMRHPEWFVAFDTDRERAVNVRRIFFKKLAERQAMICGSHLPFPSIGHVKKAGEAYEFIPTPWRWS